MKEEIKIGGKYHHFKGKDYRTIAIARDCENPNRLFVVYQALYDSPEFGKEQIWVRELGDFLGDKKLDSGIVKKFTFVPE